MTHRQNCGVASQNLKWQSEFEYWGCEDCIAECDAVLYAEQHGETDHDEVPCAKPQEDLMRAATVSDVLKVMRAHQGTECAVCRSTRKTVAPDRERLSGDRGRGEGKGAA
jgi:hypothetical protein